MTQVNFYDCYFAPDSALTYSVILPRYRGKWIFVRHRDRLTWEIPGGHIEHGETSGQAAGRELMEETGATSFNLECISTYSVIKDDNTGWGRLYFAEVSELGPVLDISEIAEIVLLDHMPENLTYADIQPHFFVKVLGQLKTSIK